MTHLNLQRVTNVDQRKFLLQVWLKLAAAFGKIAFLKSVRGKRNKQINKLIKSEKECDEIIRKEQYRERQKYFLQANTH